MKLKLILALVALLSINFSFGQNEDKYSEFIEEAWNLYLSKDYKKSAKTYKKAFKQSEDKIPQDDRYNAACSYALANKVKKSFHHLFHLAENSETKFRDLNHITTDTDLNALHSDDKWKELLALVTRNKKEYEKDMDRPLAALLDSIYEEDQECRQILGEIEKEYGWDSDEMRAQWEIISAVDSRNLILVTQVLDERGWLGPRVVGDLGNSCLFLVIQHADQKTQEKYLPMMREAVELGNAKASSLALLEDRVALGQGKRQIYGSQLQPDPETGEYFLSPLIAPETVNERRAKMGLETIEEYLAYFGLIWDLEKHKARAKKLGFD